MCADIIIGRLFGQPSVVPRICGKISATSALAEIAPPFRISPTDSGLRRLGKEICADIIIGRLVGQPSVVPRICGKISATSAFANR